MIELEHEDCDDFTPVDPGDSLCDVCVCGHVSEEHASGFFRPCRFNAEDDDE